MGHKAVLACNQPQVWGQPLLCDPHWDPVYAAAQDHDLSISFHIGGGSFEVGDKLFENFAAESAPGRQKIGTTSKGIGPAYQDKMSRGGLKNMMRGLPRGGMPPGMR